MSMDEPKSLLGLNTAPNPQEYLFAGLAGCMSVVFMAGASLINIKIESLQIDIDGQWLYFHRLMKKLNPWALWLG